MLTTQRNKEVSVKIIAKKAANLLNRIPRDKSYGTELFEAITRLSVGVVYEAVAFRLSAQKTTQVFLARRGPNEAYANLWHCPGSFFRAKERPEDVAARLSDNEFGAKIISDFFLR